MSEDKSNAAISNTLTIQGKARWIVPEEQGTPAHFCDPVSGWRSDDPYRAVHEAQAITTFRILHDTFDAGTHATNPAPDDTPQI